MRNGLPSIEALRAQIEGGEEQARGNTAVSGIEGEARLGEWPHPRWVRVNTIKSDLGEQMRTTFAGYERSKSLKEILTCSLSSQEKSVYVDEHVPNLLALPSVTNLSKTPAYLNGEIILQDKASCFPVCLLSPQLEDGDSLDACAAPGNKTTHLAAILHDECPAAARPQIYACERDRGRASTLLTLLQTAGAQDYVTAKVGQDFLKIDPAKAPWNGIGTLLLDPSCSGSGIVGREDNLNIVLPRKEVNFVPGGPSKKRKRRLTAETTSETHDVPEEIPISEEKSTAQLSVRLEALSVFQLKLLLHAFHFPRARRITYSTCSIHVEENEHVVVKALESSIAQERGWQILRREEQTFGMRVWNIRGKADACMNIAKDKEIDSREIADACIRCEKGTEEGTQGFFVAGLVRKLEKPGTGQLMDQEWEGFSDSGSTSSASKT